MKKLFKKGGSSPWLKIKKENLPWEESEGKFSFRQEMKSPLVKSKYEENFLPNTTFIKLSFDVHV